MFFASAGAVVGAIKRPGVLDTMHQRPGHGVPRHPLRTLLMIPLRHSPLTVLGQQRGAVGLEPVSQGGTYPVSQGAILLTRRLR